jgi:hypothetical protein
MNMFVIETQKEKNTPWHQVYKGLSKKSAAKKFEAIDDAMATGKLKPIRVRLAEQTVCGLSVLAVRG